MTRYLLDIWQPAGGTPDPETLAAIGAELAALTEDMRAAGQPRRRPPCRSRSGRSPDERREVFRAEYGRGRLGLVDELDLDPYYLFHAVRNGAEREQLRRRRDRRALVAVSRPAPARLAG